MIDEDDINIQTFQIHAADDSTATPRLESKVEDETFNGLKKSSSFQELSEKKVSGKSKSKGNGNLKRSSSSRTKVDKTNEILQGLSIGVGIALIAMVIDFLYLFLK